MIYESFNCRKIILRDFASRLRPFAKKQHYFPASAPTNPDLQQYTFDALIVSGRTNCAFNYDNDTDCSLSPLVACFFFYEKDDDDAKVRRSKTFKS